MSFRNALMLGVVCFLLAVPGFSFGRQTRAVGDKDPKEALLKAERELAMAEVHLDMAALDRLYADNFTHSHTSGLVQQKAVYMDHLKNGKSQFKSFEFSQEAVRFFGSTTATITAHVRGVSDNSPVGHDDTVLEVWVLEKGAWRCAAWAQARHPEEEKETR